MKSQTTTGILRASLLAALAIGGMAHAASASHATAATHGRVAKHVNSTRTAPAASTSPDVVAEVAGDSITTTELGKAIGMPLYRLESQLHDLKRQALQQIINDRLLAAEASRRQLTVPQLLEQEVTAKVVAPDDAAVDTFYQANKARLPADEKAAREQVRQLLLTQRQAQARQALLQRLAADAHIVYHLAAPLPPKVELPSAGGIVRGSGTAPVTIVEFTDFHCPFCKLAEATVAEVLAKFGDKVRYEYRDFPIARLHPQSPRAHLAARCAAEQDKFWPYHDKLFAGPSDASTEKLQGYAREAELDVTAFTACLEGNKYQATIQDNIDAGTRLGVTGTPTFFINGQMLVGAQPLSRFEEVIEQELARQAATASPAAPAPAAALQGQR